MISFTVYGVCPSLKNQKRMGRGRMYNDPQIVKYQHDFVLQVPSSYKNLRLGGQGRPLKLCVALYHDSWRRDADVAIIADCLQMAGVIENDRWLRVIEVNATRIDKQRPRAYISVQELSLLEVATGQPD